MKSSTIQSSTIQFLADLAQNNNRDWFAAHKNNYLVVQKNVIDFVDELIKNMNHHDIIENVSGKKSIYRIYNDVRFSKDKSPYNARFAFSLRRSTKYLRGGYYMQIKPGNSFLACGFFAPNPSDLKRIREDISIHFDEWNKILGSGEITASFGNLQGNKIETTPRGFHKDHKAIELLRYKQFILRHQFTDEEVTADDFLFQVNKIYKSVRPFFDHMSDILTTNANGELVV